MRRANQRMKVQATISGICPAENLMSSNRLGRAVRGIAAALCLLGGLSAVASAQVRIGVGVALPGVRIGVNIPAYPNMVPVPGYPVYYAPQLDENLFFYDGAYWLFADDDWYALVWVSRCRACGSA
jgi:hypothetical protein